MNGVHDETGDDDWWYEWRGLGSRDGRVLVAGCGLERERLEGRAS